MIVKNRNLFRATRFILLKTPRLFKFFAKFRTAKKRLLIIKTDAIGDYILFRNYIAVVKKSDLFKDYQIDLLGNALWKDIALQYDSQFIDEFFFINPDDLYHQPLNTFKLGWKLFKRNYQVVLQPTYARTFIADGLAALSAAKQIIGFDGDTERINPKYKIATDKFYTQKLSLPPNTFFEFDRHKFFFSNVLNRDVLIDGPFIEVENNDKQGVIIFPGAGVYKRSWEADKFISLIKLIIQHSSQPVALAGSAAELQTGDYIVEKLPPGSVNNLIDKTTLSQLIELIGNAALIIANETSAIHIAAATHTKAICILGGGHFNRFAPYPSHITHKPLCVFEKMECFHCNWNCKFETKGDEPYPCISAVSLESVWLAMQQLLLIA